MRARFSRLLCASVLIAASCGGGGDEPEARELDLPADASDDVDDAALGTDDGAGTSAAPSSSSTTSSTSTTLRPPPPTEPPERDRPTIGDLEIPCAPADVAALPDLPGLDTVAITIGTGTDRGGLATADAAAGTIEMVQVLADHCNANGGIAGRDVLVVDYDAAGTETVDRVSEACAEVAALVGHQFLENLEAVAAAATCSLVDYPVDERHMVREPFALHGHVAALFVDPEEAATVVLVGPDTAGDADRRNTRQTAIAAAADAVTVVGQVAYPIDTVPNWSQVVGTARATGAGQVHLAGGCTHAVVPFLQAAADAGWAPVVVTTATAYDPTCLNVPAPDRLLVELPFLPFEDEREAPATWEHTLLLDRVAAPHTGNAILAASAFWRWATAAEVCLGEPAACYADFSAEQRDWTAGGLHPAIDPSEPSATCAVVMGVEEASFVRRLPAGPGTYECAAEFSVIVPELDFGDLVEPG